MSYIPQAQAYGANITGGGPKLDIKTLAGAILILTGTTYTLTQLATMQATMQGAITVDAIAARAFLIMQLADMKDVGSKAQYEKVDIFETKASDGNAIHNFRLYGKHATKQNHENLRKFNGKEGLYDLIYFDTSGNFFGINVPNATTGQKQLGGFTLAEINIDAFEFAMGQNKNVNYPVRFAFADITQFNDSSLTIPSSFNPISGLIGVKDVTCSKLTGDHTGLTGSFWTNNGIINLADTYPALAAPGAWTCFDRTTNANITISSVTIVNSNFVYVVTGGTAADLLSIRLKAISVTKASPYNVLYVDMQPDILGNYAEGSY